MLEEKNRDVWTEEKNLREATEADRITETRRQMEDSRRVGASYGWSLRSRWMEVAERRKGTQKKGFRKRMKGRMIRLKEGWRGVGGKERYLT